MSTTNSNKTIVNHMRDLSKKQAIVHSQIAASSTAAEGTGTLTIHAYLVFGSFTAKFNIDGNCYNCSGRFPGAGWANGTVTGTITLLVNPQSLVNADTGFTLTCSSTDLNATFYLNGVSVGTFSGGAGVAGGGAFAGSCDWTNC